MIRCWLAGLRLQSALTQTLEREGAWVAKRSAQVKEEPAQRAGDTEQSALPP